VGKQIEGGAAEAAGGGADQSAAHDMPVVIAYGSLDSLPPMLLASATLSPHSSTPCSGLRASSSLYHSGNIGKPTLDMVIFTSQLAAALGPLGTAGLFANYGLTSWILRKATPAFGRMAATEAKLEGEYRAGLGRVGRDGEEVASVVLTVCVIPLNSSGSIMVERGRKASLRQHISDWRNMCTRSSKSGYLTGERYLPDQSAY